MFKPIQKETHRYVAQQIKKKNQEGPPKPKSVFAQWNTVSLQEIKTFFLIIIHMSVLCKSSLQDYRSLHLIIHTLYAASIGLSRGRFLVLLTVFHLSNNEANAGRVQPGCDLLFKIRPVIDTLITKFRMSTHRNNSWLLTRQYARFEIVYSFVFISKENPINMELCEAKSGFVYNLEVYRGSL